MKQASRRDLLADIEKVKKAYQNPTPELIEAERKMREFEESHIRLFRINEQGEFELSFAEAKKR